MKILLLALISALCLAVEGGRYSSRSYHRSSNSRHVPNRGSSYSRPGPSYGGHRGYGYPPGPSYGGPGGYGYSGYDYSYRNPTHANEPLDQVDKLYERATDVLAQVKFFSEEVEALSSALAIQEKKLKELMLVVFTELEETDIRQNADISKLQGHLKELMMDNMELETHLDNLKYENDENRVDGELIDVLAARERARNTKQDGQVYYLDSTVRNLKNHMLQVMGNYFDCFSNEIGRDTTSVNSIHSRESRRMCEVGQVTLKSDDRRVEYHYENWFDTVPQVLYGITGFNFDLSSRFNSYYQNDYQNEPEAIGGIVHVYSTKTGLTVENVDLSFGQTSGVTMDVAFQACTIGPGAQLPTDH